MRIFRRKQFETDMDAELRFHIAAYVDDLVRSGLDRGDAERRARIEFGSIETKKEECRQAHGLQLVDELRADLRLTFRMLRRNPGFAAIAVLSLALGIGANTAIFGLVDAVMLRLLPVYQPERLRFVQVAGTEGTNGGPPYPCFELLRDRNQTFEGMAAFSASGMELAMGDGRELVRGIWVSGNFYNLLGVKPLIGRALASSDDQVAGKGGLDGGVVVISKAYWQRRFGGDPSVVGRTVRLFQSTVNIVGVLPTEAMSLEPGRPIDIAAPMMLSDPATLANRGAWWMEIVGRLKPRVHPQKAAADADVLFQSFMADSSASPSRKMYFDHVEVAPAARGQDSLRKQFSNPLAALMVLAGLVLLAACANVANLMLARATSREKEFAVRLAIGAGGARLVRQTLTEAMALVSLGALLGIGLAVRAETLLAGYFAEGNRQIVLDLSLNERMLLFTVALSLVTGLAFGIMPARRASRVSPGAGLQSGSRTVAGSRPALRAGRALMILQVALSTVLLAGAGLFIRSLGQLQSVDLGFVRQGVLTMEVAPERELSGKPEWLALEQQIRARVLELPGVLSAGWSTMGPLSGRDRAVGLVVPGFVAPSPKDNNIHLVSISPGYFETYGTPLLVGRAFTDRDNPVAPKVAILNETAARFYFGNISPLGRRVSFVRQSGDPGFEVIGVVKDVKQNGPRRDSWRTVYLPIPQSIDPINRLAFSIHTSSDAGLLTTPVQREVRNARSSLLITNVTSIERLVEQSLMRERLVSTLSLAFGVLALALACIGLYGVLAYAVARRTNEIGIRMALGASRHSVVWLVLREALLLACIGIALGVPAAGALGRISKTFLFGVQPYDLPSLATTALLLLTFAAIAGVIPARSASRLDPMAALRSE